jgi:uncharacterized protein
MLRHTFCHIPGISAAKERMLWDAGIDSWEALSRVEHLRLPRKLAASLPDHIEQSRVRLEARSPAWFAERLKSAEHWRLFPEFRDSIAYLDIETTGLGYRDSITTIALYDGRSTHTYVRGENLGDFPLDIRRYALIVTYNGKCFDVPFIENQFRIGLTQAHIDLRYVLRSLGYSGGLKACERRFGIDRKDLADVDGYFAVLLWNDFVRSRNRRALETLLAYNVQDVVNLETLLVRAYNLKVSETPFHRRLKLDLPRAPVLPFEADRTTIDRIRRQNPWSGGRW